VLAQARDNANPDNANPDNANPDNTNPGTPSDSTPGADDAPEIASAAGQDLGKIFPASATLPRLTAPTSQGVAGGTLVHKVQPVYPAEARRMHLEGTVILEAIVTEQGQIENLKLVSGHPILAQAALAAVSQWRYSPYLLNGNPTQKQTRISVSFLAPQ
jgi:periplasmic protein TonB